MKKVKEETTVNKRDLMAIMSGLKGCEEAIAILIGEGQCYDFPRLNKAKLVLYKHYKIIDKKMKQNKRVKK